MLGGELNDALCLPEWGNEYYLDLAGIESLTSTIRFPLKRGIIRRKVENGSVLMGEVVFYH